MHQGRVRLLTENTARTSTIDRRIRSSSVSDPDCVALRNGFSEAITTTAETPKARSMEACEILVLSSSTMDARYISQKLNTLEQLQAE